ncbi:hypothetical protein YYE_01202 [Plasmodium vinckei vinckei]|nr:hypothetical protein YYE_01202 [Plasmodium vinckei vinckei]
MIDDIFQKSKKTPGNTYAEKNDNNKDSITKNEKMNHQTLKNKNCNNKKQNEYGREKIKEERTRNCQLLNEKQKEKQGNQEQIMETQKEL